MMVFNRGSAGVCHRPAGSLIIARISQQCTHLNSVKDVRPSGTGCVECLEMGDTWVHLRLCRTCGHVGCCDDSKNRHARKHFKKSTHPIISSFEPGEDWSWCFIDEIEVELK
jgi:uncharacterized UBP type Zn finger protein